MINWFRRWTMQETWKPVLGYEGLYEVSDAGRVRSRGRAYRMRNSRRPEVIMDCYRKGKPLKPGMTAAGYAQVMLYALDKSKRQPLVHRLVLEAFVGPAPEGMEANHINGQPFDNRLCNLEWITHGENMAHSRQVLGAMQGEKNHNAKLTADLVRELRQAKADGLPISPIANRIGVSVVAACNAANGTTWRHVA